MIGHELRRRLALLTAHERLRWATLLPVGAATAALEAVGAVFVYGLIAILSGSGATLPAIVAPLERWLARTGTGSTAVAFTAIAAAVHLLKNCAILLSSIHHARVSGEIAAALSARTLRSYLRAPYVFHLRRGSADLAQNVVSAVPALLGSLDSVATLVTEILVVTALIVVLCAVAPLETVVATLVIVGPLYPFMRASRHAHARFGARHHELGIAVLEGLQQAFGGIKELKVFGRETYFYDALARRQRERARCTTTRR